MDVYSYVVEHDMGFAPNPFHGICTLACCKPDIRKHANEGDIIIGTSGMKSGSNNRLVYWLKVEGIISFDEYWRDARFERKRPNVLGPLIQQYGDNIYYRDNPLDLDAPLNQLHSFHSLPDGKVNADNHRQDTRKTENVLFGKEFAYWGGYGPVIPNHLRDIIKKGPSHKKKIPTAKQEEIFAWFKHLGSKGFVADPAAWQGIIAKGK